MNVSDNDAVRRSLSGLARAMQSGSYLIYTGQPWHPQLEMIARTLTSHRGHQSWVMRRRTQAELDVLVSDAGFEKLEQWTDQWEYYRNAGAQEITRDLAYLSPKI